MKVKIVLEEGGKFLKIFCVLYLKYATGLAQC